MCVRIQIDNIISISATFYIIMGLVFAIHFHDRDFVKQKENN